MTAHGTRLSIDQTARDAVAAESSNRQSADSNLQSQIDGISVTETDPVATAALATHAASTTAHGIGTAAALASDTDNTLAADSDSRLATQKAVKGYVTTQTGLLVPKSLIDAKGDLLVGTADNTVARKAVGSNGKVLVADSGQSDGLRWGKIAPAFPIAYNDTALLNALPTMASPPTITVSSAYNDVAAAVAATSISGASRFSPAALGGTPVAYVKVGTNATADFQNAGSTRCYNALNTGSVDFDFDGDAFEFIFYGYSVGSGVKLRVWVNGECANSSGTTAQTDNKDHLMKVDFGSRAWRRIRVEWSSIGSACLWSGVMAKPTDTVIYPVNSPGPKVSILSDSFGMGPSTGVAGDGWAFRLPAMLGCRAPLISAVSGSGYTAGTPYTNSGRITTVTTGSPDLIIVQGSVNDDGASSGAFSTAASSVFSSLRSAAPDATIMATSVMWPRSGLYGSNSASRNTAIQSAVEAVGGYYIDTAGWFTGTGNSGSTNGTGNSDYFLGSDSTHPTAAGHLYIARQMARSLLGYFA